MSAILDTDFYECLLDDNELLIELNKYSKGDLNLIKRVDLYLGYFYILMSNLIESKDILQNRNI